MKYFSCVGFICYVQSELDKIKETLTERIRILFMEQHNGNKLQFAKKVGCDEKTLRLIFDKNQGMTMNLFFKIAHALNIDPSELIKGLKIDLENDI
ncbi:helix-turn-helix domain-containing protein [Flavobacterium sp. 7A]|uniref:helix-turn-helix domain-containing protein n=1 Tax=Flavobacterium sp. 7A TaxID=2940571 RepID=UPI0022271FE9|nr:helix-turn-helix transcriptional regulator [Flavobacterium sp. 7A]MCW2119101.1 transcriptional regulator with XRE-family HTH domain [Flavobacterium sp. 7A]